ncbi:MAG: response regulator [Actinomycetota bacterium]|nr:response regulator [Actinomycetota bacterium]
MKIAVIEDNADNRMLVRAILEDIYELAEYESGQDALEEFKKDRPLLILLDISLPGMDGMEVFKALRADVNLRGVPVVALTAHAMAGDRGKYLAAGFDGYISKPILDEKLLLDTIEKLLKKNLSNE